MKQETHKGRGALDPAGASWAGWEFAEHEELVIEIPPTYATVRDYSAAEANAANAANPLVFAESPVFRKNPPEMFTNSLPAVLRNEQLLADAIPALSNPAGSDPTNKFNLPGQSRNHDMHGMRNGWPQDRLDDDDYLNHWQHSDVKNVAFWYVHNVFNEICIEGGMK